jgi:hypothetical protein
MTGNILEYILEKTGAANPFGIQNNFPSEKPPEGGFDDGGLHQKVLAHLPIHN